MEEYESFEQKVADAFAPDKKLGIFTRETIYSAYGTIASMFKMPTTIRKILNGQTRVQRGDYKDFSKKLGLIAGGLVGCATDGVFVSYAISEASNKNYVPLAALGLSNFGFLCGELGRLKESKQEHSELKNKKNSLEGLNFDLEEGLRHE
jgi:hypothetical protein